MDKVVLIIDMLSDFFREGRLKEHHEVSLRYLGKDISRVLNNHQIMNGE